MNRLIDNTTLIIRSVGERTEQLCRELILAQGVSPENVVIVREAPFSATMRKSYQIGIERGLPWTFCVDADLLLRPGSLEAMINLAEEQDDAVCEVQGYILDKFFGGPREAGNHLYRTQHLPIALECIPEEGVNIRPEAQTLETMRIRGYPWISVPYLIGLHDFEQFYCDIFRKCFVHAHKHPQWSVIFMTIWRNGFSHDADYLAALRGYAAGIAHIEDVYIDTRQEIYRTEFTRSGIKEKDPLAADGYTLDAIEGIIANWIEPEVYLRYFPTKWGLVKPPELEPLSPREKFIRRKEELGIAKMAPYTLGWVLKQSGDKILSLVSPNPETRAP